MTMINNNSTDSLTSSSLDSSSSGSFDEIKYPPLAGLDKHAISKSDLSPAAVTMLMTPREGHQLYEDGVCGQLSPRLPENYLPVSVLLIAMFSQFLLIVNDDVF